MERDVETNNDFFQARYMSAFQGRFTSPDPLGNFVANAADPQTWNMYAYVRNNPLAFVDPTGYDYCDLGGGDTSYDPSVGGLTQGECAYEQGTWVVPTVNDTVTGGQNEGVMTLNLDGWLDQWSAENGPVSSGFTFYGPVSPTSTPSPALTSRSLPKCSSFGALGAVAAGMSLASQWASEGFTLGVNGNGLKAGGVGPVGVGADIAVSLALVSDPAGEVGIAKSLSVTPSVGARSYGIGLIVGGSTFPNLSGYSSYSNVDFTATGGAGLATGFTVASNSSGFSTTAYVGFGTGLSAGAKGLSLTNDVQPFCQQ
jgi:RHS repeat-associated protein